MPVFQFYSLSGEDKQALRENPQHCRALLATCASLAHKLATTQGIYTQLTIEDEEHLQGFHSVAQAYEGYRHESTFDQLAQQATLLPSDIGLLSGRVRTLYQEREPALYAAEVHLHFTQWTKHAE
jgi:hypothetical protein